MNVSNFMNKEKQNVLLKNNTYMIHIKMPPSLILASDETSFLVSILEKLFLLQATKTPKGLKRADSVCPLPAVS